MKKYVIGIVVLVLIVAGYFLLNQKNNDSYSSDWVSSNLSDNYDLKVWYPDNLNFYCCNDTENGTFHSISTQDGESVVTVGEKINFCPDFLDTECPSLKEFFNGRSVLTSEEISAITSISLGESIFAIDSDHYEVYYFDTMNENKKFGYYSVKFHKSSGVSSKFKKEFIKRLELK